jgi:hypothetical protein
MARNLCSRTFCITLAAIPREHDRLALELAQTADFRPKSVKARSLMRI